jgi:drug/metabolite transporter (DMT)-like permease
MSARNAVRFGALAVAWGSAFTVIKAGLEFFPPVLFAALRYDLAGLLMLGYAGYATDRWLPRGRSEWTLIGVSGLFVIAGYHAFLFVGQQGTTSAAAAIVVSLSPVLTPAFARVLLPDERLTLVGTLGLLVGFVGVGVLSDPDPGRLLDARTVSLGLVLLAAASFALGSVLTRRVETALPIETMEAWSMLVGALVMHGASVGLSESASEIRWTLDAVGSLAYLAVVASALGFLVYFDLLDRLGPIEINLISYATPVVAAVTGFLLLDETPTAATAVGFVLIVSGFALLKRDAIRQELLRLRSLDERSGSD